MCLNIRPGRLQSNKRALVQRPLTYPLNTAQVHRRADAVNHSHVPSRSWKESDSMSRTDDKAGLVRMRAVRASPSFHPP